MLVLSLSMGVVGGATAAQATSGARTAAVQAVQLVDHDCSDFATQAAAQHYFLNHGGPHSDPERLDADGDGIACESNPCPCYYGTGGGGGGGDDHSHPPKTLRQHAKITKVVDGDTVKVRLASGGRASVRLIGIDTPEVYGGVECGGPEASKAAKRMVPRGTKVLLVSDPSQHLKDRYGRLLRYVMKGSLDVGRRQLWLGNARVYVFHHHPFKRTRLYKKVSADARQHDRGIWGNC